MNKSFVNPRHSRAKFVGICLAAQLIAAFERALIERCLTETGGNIGAVMERLSIPRRTLNEKMQRLGIDRHRFVRTGGSLDRTCPPEQGSISAMTSVVELSKAR